MKKPYLLAVAVLPLGLSACGGGATIVSVSMHDVVHVAKHGLDHAAEVKGSKELTAAEVLHGVEGMIAEQAHYSYWHAEEVGGAVEVQFRNVSPYWIKEHPDMAMPELGTKAEIEERAAKKKAESPDSTDAGEKTPDTAENKDTAESTDTTVKEHGLGGVALVPARYVAAGGAAEDDGPVTVEEQVAELSSGGGDTPQDTAVDTPHDTGGEAHTTGETTHDTTSSDSTKSGGSSHDGAADAHGSKGDVYEWEVALAACVLEGPVGWTVREGRCSGSAEKGEYHEVHWGYEFANGPEKWGELSEEWRVCADGSAQSPIDIAGAKTRALVDLKFSYKPGPVVVEDNGHAIVVSFPEGSAMVLDGVEYPLVQAHYHARSEHTIEGESYPVEWHFVHKTAAGELAVVGVMVVEGATNEAWNDVVLAVASGGKTVNVTTVDPAAMLPEEKLSVRYNGSLTTPPCSEGVKWNLFTATIEMSKAQIEVLTYRYSGNNRPVQPLNGREIVADDAADK